MSSERNPLLLNDDYQDPFGMDEKIEPAEETYDPSEIASFESIHFVNEVYRSVPHVESAYIFSLLPFHYFCTNYLVVNLRSMIF